MKWKNIVSHISAKEYTAAAKKLSEYQQQLRMIVKKTDFTTPESSLCLPSDAKTQKDVASCIRATVHPNLRYIIVVGIGGSNLGTKAVYDALEGYNDVLASNRFPKILFVDTLQSEWIGHICALLSCIRNADEILLVIISKSGATTETIAATEVLLSAGKHVAGIMQRIIAITDENSLLWRKAHEYGWHTLAIPSLVGGRFSIFSSVGLYPLAAAGYDTEGLCKGALDMRKLCLGKPFQNNPALFSAINLFLHNQKGFAVHDTFLFAPQLESLGKWYRQLLAESIGKDGIGIIPTISIGSTDLHSMSQLYLGGPKKIITTFVRIASKSKISVPVKGVLHDIVQGIGSRPLSVIMNALLKGTETAYRKASLPFSECELQTISEKELGAFFQWKMMEIMYLGQLFGINAFDQPNVESYKIESRKCLKG